MKIPNKYEILIIEQDDESRFNRGKLINIGAKIGFLHLKKACETKQAENNYCVISHDIDMLPLNDTLDYTCEKSPKLFATAAEQFNYTMPYQQYFGGVVAVKWNDLVKINGLPNR